MCTSASLMFWGFCSVHKQVHLFILIGTVQSSPRKKQVQEVTSKCWHPWEYYAEVVPKRRWSARNQWQDDANRPRRGRRHRQGFPQGKSVNSCQWGCFEGIGYHWLPLSQGWTAAGCSKCTNKQRWGHDLWCLLVIAWLIRDDRLLISIRNSYF